MSISTELTAEQSRFRDEVRAFVQEHLAPVADEIDASGTFPTEVYAAMGSQGLLGIPVPEEYEGRGADLVCLMLALEELSSVCPATALGVAAHTSLVALPILGSGTEEQKRAYVPELASGRRLGSFGLTESHAGSDAASSRTRAVRDGDTYVLNGSKAYTTNANHASIFVVTARTSDAPGAHGISSFIVERDFEGFSIGHREDKLGLKSSDTAEIYFEDCRVPVANRLGAEGHGFYNFMNALDGGRIGIASMGVGIMRASIEVVRRALGDDIGRVSGLMRERVADMATSLHVARLLVYDAVHRRMQGLPHTRQAAMAKLFSSEACNRVVRDAVQALGERGCSRELPLERFLRDAKLLEIGEGTSEIQRLVISREVFEADDNGTD